MMKKMLIFGVVLALSTSCSAVSISLLSGGLDSVSVNIDDIIKIDLVVDNNPCSGIDSIDFISTAGALTAASSGAAAWVGFPDGVGLVAGNDSSGNIIAASGHAESNTQALAGTVLYTFDLTVTQAGTVAPNMGSNLGYDLDTHGFWQPSIQNALIVSIIPEPMTAAILVIGSLFIRRRR